MSLDVAPRSVLESYYDYVDDGETEALLELFADDVRYERPGQGTIEGIDELRAFYERNRPLEDGLHEIDRMLVVDDCAAVRGRFTGVQDGEEVEFGFADHHEFDDDGLITDRWSYTDRDTV
ncbi:nuclear transport factor 2 family protein [Halosolutus gelatinilyticus]|uniref:nuclear transport factor 2 family protein n=1 Tax=Halosolutus gelatinilyticus TaxID=2931975 RepID=UPI001FF0F325|nr:nuclear transport factor 2 family protein [Halosolutus gelatinilyticus]